MLDLEHLKKLNECRHEGEWTRCKTPSGLGNYATYTVQVNGVAVCQQIDSIWDADYIAHACNSLPELITEVERLRNIIRTCHLATKCV